MKGRNQIPEEERSSTLGGAKEEKGTGRSKKGRKFVEAQNWWEKKENGNILEKEKANNPEK